MQEKTKFGLIGKNISFSFSQGYFKEKFKNLKFENHKYRNYDLPEISEFPFITYHREEFGGFNVTIPYKESIIKYLSKLDDDAQVIGAVNTIKITRDNKLIGFNTDVYGFENSLKPLLKSHHKKALILGTGGASKAIAFVLNKLNIDFQFVSRNPISEGVISYKSLSKAIINEHNLIVNSTPLGTFPAILDCPDIPYEFLTKNHVLYDLIYNPSETEFLKRGKKQGAIIKNGLEMLELQAEKSWEIWNS